MYGFFPRVPEMQFRIAKEDSDVLNGQVTYREVEVSFDGLGEAGMTVALFLPNQAISPSPALSYDALSAR